MTRKTVPRTGIVTRYTWHEATYVALRVADYLQRHACPVSLFPVGPSTKLGTGWDSQLCRHRFVPWLETVDQVVTTHRLSREQMAWLTQQRKRVVAVPVWHELMLGDLPLFVNADCVLSPSKAQADWLWAGFGKRATWLPWETGQPLTSKMARPRPLRLLWPLYDGNARRTSVAYARAIGRVMQDHPEAKLTILADSATLPGPLRRQVRRMLSANVVLQRGAGLAAREMAYMQHDLTVWPTQAESFGLVGLTSIACGTPLLTVGVPPVDEICTADRGWAVPTAISYSPHSVPYAADGAMVFELELRKLLTVPERVWERQGTVLHGLPERRTLFEQTLGRALLVQ